MGDGSGGKSTLALRAAHDKVEPCRISDTRTIKKATLKNSWALGKPATSGNTAKITGTAPRKPIQEINTRSRRLKPRKGNKPKNTDNGRANKIIHSDNNKAGTAIGNNSWGVNNKPSTKNMPI